VAAASPASAKGPVAFTWGFDDEAENAGWITEGAAGIDRGLGYAFRGPNNGWIAARDVGAWSSLRHDFSAAGYVCNAGMFLRSSGNVTGAYASILDHTGQIVAERNLDPNLLNNANPGGYVPFGLNLRAPVIIPGETMTVRIGFWGNGQDAWLQVDEVHVDCW